MNVKLTIEYDGTRYHGWQVQPNGETIQEVLETALATLLGGKVRLNGSGRTDAGVHALGQVANFVWPGELDLWRFQKGLNALTPSDIVVKAVDRAPDAFDARRDARGRIYQYRIWNCPWPSAFHVGFSWHVPLPLDVAAMEKAVRVLEGEHDFSSFRAVGCEATHPVRRIYANSVAREDDLVIYTCEGTAYLRHMVRNIVGTLVEVGRGERSAAAFAELLSARDRKQAGPTAPAKGLFLVAIKY